MRKLQCLAFRIILNMLPVDEHAIRKRCMLQLVFIISFIFRTLYVRFQSIFAYLPTCRHFRFMDIRVGVKYNWSSTQILQVLVIKYKYKYFAFSTIKYSSTSSTDTPSTSTSTSTSVNIGWLMYTGNTRAVIPGKYRPVQ